MSLTVGPRNLPEGLEEVGPYEAGGLRVTFEGRTAWLGVSTSDPVELRAAAADMESRAQEILYRARRARALADHYEAWRAEERERRARQRRERAAATRERNRDPFGFKAMEAQWVDVTDHVVDAVTTEGRPEEEGR